MKDIIHQEVWKLAFLHSPSKMQALAANGDHFRLMVVVLVLLSMI